jgi:hypothetical protein
VIGTPRRDCLDHVLIFWERHLRRALTLCSLNNKEMRFMQPQPAEGGRLPSAVMEECAAVGAVVNFRLSTWSIRYRRATAWVIRLGRVRRLEGGLSDSLAPLRQVFLFSLPVHSSNWLASPGEQRCCSKKRTL